MSQLISAMPLPVHEFPTLVRCLANSSAAGGGANLKLHLQIRMEQGRNPLI